MGAFFNGFLKGVGDSINDQLEEQRQLEKRQQLLETQAKYDMAIESYKVSLKKNAEYDQAKEVVDAFLGPDAPMDIKAQAIQALVLGADANTVLTRAQRQIKQTAITPQPTSAPLPGMQIQQSTTYDTPIPPERQQEYEKYKSQLPPPLQSTQDYDLQGAFLAGAVPDANGHMTDKFKKPNHPTFSNQSEYSTPQTPGGTWAGPNQDQYVPNEKPKAPWDLVDNTVSLLAPAIKAEDRQKTLKPLDDFIDMARKSGDLNLVQEASDAQTAIMSVSDEEEAKLVTRDSLTYLYNKAKGANFNVLGSQQREKAADLFKSAANDALQFKNPTAAKRLAMLSMKAMDGSSDINSVMLEGQEIISTLRKPVSDEVSYSRLKDQLSALDTAKDQAVKEGDYPRAIELDRQKAQMLGSGKVDQAVIEGIAGNTDRYYSDQVRQEAAKSAAMAIEPKLGKAPGLNLDFDENNNLRRVTSGDNTVKADVEFEAQAASEIAFFAMKKGIIAGEDPRVVASNVGNLLNQDFGTIATDTAGPGSKKSDKVEQINSFWLKVLKDPDFEKTAPTGARLLRESIANNYKGGSQFIQKVQQQGPKEPSALPGGKVAPKAPQGLPQKQPTPKAPTAFKSEDPRGTDKNYGEMIELIREENQRKSDTADPAIVELSTRLAKANPTEKQKIASEARFNKETISKLLEYEESKPRTVADPAKAPEGLKDFARDLNDTAAELLKETRKSGEKEKVGGDPIRKAVVKRQLDVIKEMNEERFNQFLDAIVDPDLKNLFIRLHKK